MNKTKIILATICLLTTANNQYASADQVKLMTDYEVIDGDTIRYVDNGKKHLLRLWGIDADELSQKCHKDDTAITGAGNFHKQELINLLKNTKKLECTIFTRVNKKGQTVYVTDMYKRHFGVCYADNINIINRLSSLKILTKPTQYKSWIKPNNELYFKMIKEMADDSMILLHSKPETKQFVDELLDAASKMERNSINRVCTIKTPAEWRKISKRK